MPDIILETDRLVLRTEAPGDLAFWLEQMNTEEVLRYLGGTREPHQVEAAFAQAAAGIARDGFGFWIIQLKATGAPIGKAGLNRIETDAAPMALRGAVQIGWSLHPNHWRQGFASEAAQAILTHGFTRLGMEKIYAQTSESNIASWRMMEKLGMRRVSELGYNDPDYPPTERPTIVYLKEKAAP
jgi:RimJ/RimL family protein N-acetyltransferase